MNERERPTARAYFVLVDYKADCSTTSILYFIRAAMANGKHVRTGASRSSSTRPALVAAGAIRWTKQKQQATANANFIIVFDSVRVSGPTNGVVA